MPTGNPKNIANLKFDRLIPIKPIGKSRQGILWECKCDCGNSFKAYATALIGEKVRSCGCLRKESLIRSNKEYPRRSLPDEISASRSKFYVYKRRAKVDEILFDLNFDQFLQLIAKNCSYCGAIPVNVGLINGRNKNFKCNGIDRKNSNEGYTTNNCVSCCSQCNYAKSDYLEEEFIEHAYRIVKHQEKLKDEPSRT